MIQRIQSLYLSVAVIILALMWFVPIATITVDAPEPESLYMADFGFLHYLALAAGVVTFFTIFLFRNRSLQRRIAMLALLLTFVLLVWQSIEVWQYQKGLSESAEFSLYFGTFLPVLSLIFISLAISGIRKDERIVRSMDRLR